MVTKKKPLKDVIAQLESDLSVAKAEKNAKKIQAILKMLNYLKSKK